MKSDEKKPLEDSENQPNTSHSEASNKKKIVEPEVIDSRQESQETFEEVPPVPPMKKENKVLSFLKRHAVSILLLLALIVVWIWLSSKNSAQQQQFSEEKTALEQEKTTLISTYENRLDSLKVDQIKFASEVFTWSVRSELLRNNEENLNQLVSVFVRDSHTDLVQIVTIDDKKIILSSDKKYEGETYTGKVDLSVSKSVVVGDESKKQIVVPIMGFNSKLAVLIITL